MRTPLKPTHGVLALLCLMYFITYIDRVNFSTAAIDIQPEFELSNTELGFIFSAFNSPTLLPGDRRLDRGSFRAAQDLVRLWGGVGGRDHPHRSYRRHHHLNPCESAARLGRRRNLSDRDARHAKLGRARQARLRAEACTHSFARLGNAITPPVVAFLMMTVTWRGSFVVLGCTASSGCSPGSGTTGTIRGTIPVSPLGALRLAGTGGGAAPGKFPGARLPKRIWPVTLTYFCYGWCLAIYLSWLPLFFKKLRPRPPAIGDLLLRRVPGWARRRFYRRIASDHVCGAPAISASRDSASFSSASWDRCCRLVPLLLTRDLTSVRLCLSAGFFFFELIIGPIWSIPMDIAPKYSARPPA